MVEFIDASIVDLVAATRFLHAIKPSLKNMLVYGIEKHKPEDRSIVFHLMNRESKDDEQDLKESFTFVLSSDYILEHPIWKGLKND
jgi:hypothetical protein